MKIKNLKYTLNFTLIGLLVSLFFPLFVIGACETELSNWQSCRTSLAHCLYCDEHPGAMGCVGNECDSVTTVNGCGDEEFLYNSCLATQNAGGQNPDGGGNNEQGSNGQSNNQGGTQSNGGGQSQNGGTNQGNGGNNTCHHLLQSGGTCDLGYRTGTASDGTACCVLVCGGSGYLSGDANGSYTCESCVPGETKPNESHTRCICDPDFKCCGVQLNNTIPFIGDCIEMNAESSRDNTTNVNSVTAFPILMQGLMKILMSVIMIFSFLMIIVAGLMIVSGAFGGNGFTTGKKIIKNVIISLILLGCSGLILSLINPSFFGG